MAFNREKQPTESIIGLRISPRRRLFDDRGAVFHMLRRDDPEFQQFGEVYFSRIYPGVVKAWHRHSRSAMNYLLVLGSIRLALFDDRDDSPTKGRLQELYLDESISNLVGIPPMVWYGFRALGTQAALIANCATEPHDPSEVARLPHDDPYFNYDWSLRNG